MIGAKAKSTLVVVRHTPYGTSLGRSALEFALSAATFDQEIAVFFTGKGVLQLVPKQDSEAIESRNLGKLLSSFPLYDLDQVFVDSAALAKFGLNQSELSVSAQYLCADKIRSLYNRYDHIIGF